jgi:hypothetical protein
VSGGNQCWATGAHSTAFGANARASNDMATSLGYDTTSSGYAAFTAGQTLTASGGHSVAMGYNNTASGQYSVVFGTGSTAAGVRGIVAGTSTINSGNDYSAAFGNSTITGTGGDYTLVAGTGTATGGAAMAVGAVTAANANYTVASGVYSIASLLGQVAHASGRFAASADAQRSTVTLFRAITGVAAAELFLDGATLQYDLGAGNRAVNISATITASVLTVGNGSGIAVGDSAVFRRYFGIKRITNDPGTALIGAVETIGTDKLDAGAAGMTVTITADTTTGSAKITGTPPTGAGSTTVTRFVCVFECVELGL